MEDGITADGPTRESVMPSGDENVVIVIGIVVVAVGIDVVMDAPTGDD